jgi:hypothetical protein
VFERGAQRALKKGGDKGLGELGDDVRVELFPLRRGIGLGHTQDLVHSFRGIAFIPGVLGDT